jgi:hypothetical protein
MLSLLTRVTRALLSDNSTYSGTLRASNCHQTLHPFAEVASPLGPLAPLAGKWTGATTDFPEQTLTNATSFRTSGNGLHGITQAMVNNPNSVLHTAIAGQHHHADPLHHRRRGHERRLPQGRQRRGECARGRGRLHALAGDAAGSVGSHPAAVQPDRPAQLQRPELAARHGRDAQEGVTAASIAARPASAQRPAEREFRP